MLNKHSGDLKEQSIAERENIGKLLPFKIGADFKLKRIVEAESVGSRGVKARRVIVDGSNSSPNQSTERDQMTSNDEAGTTVRSDFYAPFGKSNAPTTAIDANHKCKLSNKALGVLVKSSTQAFMRYKKFIV